MQPYSIFRATLITEDARFHATFHRHFDKLILVPVEDNWNDTLIYRAFSSAYKWPEDHGIYNHTINGLIWALDAQTEKHWRVKIERIDGILEI